MTLDERSSQITLERPSLTVVHNVDSPAQTVMMTLLRYQTLILILLCLFQVGPVQAGWEKTCNLEDRREGPAPRGICGSRIPEVLRITCVLKRHRRSTEIKPKTFETSTLKDITLEKSTALSYLLKRWGSGGDGEQGITCECCYNQCNLAELLQYC